MDVGKKKKRKRALWAEDKAVCGEQRTTGLCEKREEREERKREEER